MSDAQPTSPSQTKSNPLALLSYLGILVLVPLLTKPEDEFTKFHVKQGLVLFIAEVITMAIGRLPLLGWLISFLFSTLWLILSIVGLVNVLGQKQQPLPLIGGYADKIKI